MVYLHPAPLTVRLAVLVLVLAWAKPAEVHQQLSSTHTISTTLQVQIRNQVAPPAIPSAIPTRTERPSLGTEEDFWTSLQRRAGWLRDFLPAPGHGLAHTRSVVIDGFCNSVMLVGVTADVAHLIHFFIFLSCLLQ